MRKWIVLVLVFLSLSQVRASQLQPQFRTWKTSYTESSDLNVIMATAPIILHAVLIGSPTVNTASSLIVFYNSTMSVFTAGLSTKSYLNLDSNLVLTPVDHVYDIPFSSYTMYSKQGAAKITILWDYIIPPMAPAFDPR